MGGLGACQMAFPGRSLGLARYGRENGNFVLVS